MWYCAAKDRHDGPYSEGEIRSFLDNDLIDETTLVWRRGMDSWAPLKDSALAPLVGRPPPPEFDQPPPPPGSNVPDGFAGGGGLRGGAIPHGSHTRPPPRADSAGPLELAGIWRRLIALWIDAMITWALAWISLFIVLGVFNISSDMLPTPTWVTGGGIGLDLPEQPNQSTISWPLWMLIITPTLYHGFLNASAWQATLGKRIMGVYVTSDRGERISLPTALFRHLLSYLSSFIFWIGYVIAIWMENRKTLHDMVCGTRVYLGRKE